ncbi:MAG TPA: tetratricopeptide repeat protein [Pyrinomonadaceae bacterium]|nr:tetratricopeptide repeat protein [Pyrinomonadaceae bacterium]
MVVRKALSLDPNLAQPHAALAYYLSAVAWNWAEADREFRRGIELDPKYATAHHWYAYHLTSMGRLHEAMAELLRAQELEPDSLIIATDVGQILFMDQQYAGAVVNYRKVLEREPNFAMAHLRLAEAYVQTDQFTAALDELDKAKTLGVGIEGHLAYLNARSGHRESAEKAIHDLAEQMRMGERHDPVSIAMACAALGQDDAAFKWLDEGYVRHDGEMALLLVDPRFEKLRSDPRFKELLKRMNLN